MYVLLECFINVNTRQYMYKFLRGVIFGVLESTSLAQDFHPQNSVDKTLSTKLRLASIGEQDTHERLCLTTCMG